MAEKKSLTILVAVLNKKETIKDCVESLFNAASLKTRVLVTDGGSTDGTYEILKEYGDKIDLRQFPGTGLSWRLNWALQNVKTEYVALTDADCVVDGLWLTELLKGFDEPNVIASAGFCGTPKNVSLLQRLIGMELEARFKKFPKYLRRAPTMNLCLKTEIARRVGFDQNQGVGVETDFGFRLTKLGKMIYVPKAKVWHFHRSSLKSYFNQQSSQAKWGLRLLFNHKGAALSDPITTFGMTVQIPIFSGLALSLMLLALNKIFLIPFLIFTTALFFIYLKNLADIKSPIKYCPAFFLLFLFRTLAWTYGISQGLFSLPKMLAPKKAAV